MVGLRDKESSLRHEMDQLREQLKHEQLKSKQYLEQVRERLLLKKITYHGKRG
jgi:hypothetical protein